MLDIGSFLCYTTMWGDIMASANWMKATTQKAGAMKKHLGQEEREHVNHSNKEIDRSLSKNNYALGCSDYSEALESMKRRTKEVDKLIPPKRIRKDRVTCCFIELPCPRELTERGLSDDFFKGAYKTLCDFFGEKNVHGGFVHKDEVHTYTDKDKTLRTSLEHIHVLVSAYTPEKGINGKAFETRARLKALNSALDDMCFRSFGVRLNTKETPAHKSVERLKEESELMDKAGRLLKSVNDLQQAEQKAITNAAEAENNALLAEERAERAVSSAENAEIRTEAAKKELAEAEHQLKITNKKHEAAAKDLESVLDKKARASEIHKISHIFGETVEYNKNMLDSTRAIGSEAFKNLQKAHEERQEAAESLAKAEEMQRSVKPLHDKAQTEYEQAKQERKKQQQLRENMEKEIESRADALAEEKIAAMFGTVPRGKAQRLEEFCRSVKYDDGTSVLDKFNQQELELLKRSQKKSKNRGASSLE